MNGRNHVWNRRSIAGAVTLAVLMLVSLFSWREISLDRDQRVFSAMLREEAGNYNENRVVLSSTNREEAQALAQVFGGTLRITGDGSFAVINLPEGMTLTDIAENREFRRYHGIIGLDYNNFTAVEEEAADDSDLRSDHLAGDPMYVQQSYLNYINIGDTWDLTRGTKDDGNKVTVAIIDTGIDSDHPDFYDAEGNRIISTSSYNATTDTVGISAVEDTDGHGTAVAGVIAAQLNETGIVGIAPDVELLIIKCESDEAGNYKSSADIVFGIFYAIEMDADVINMSLSGQHGDMEQALQLAVDSDIICVASAGNDGTDQPQYPAAFDTVIGVGALADESWELAEYSNYGINSDIVAPGTVLTAELGGAYTYMSGTSMSAPMVSAAAALYIAHDPYTSSQTLMSELTASGKDLGDAGEDDYYGFGALDIHSFVCGEKGVITYDYCTEELMPAEQVFVRGHTIQTVPEPERENLIFDDWYYDRAFTQVFDYETWYTTEFVADVTLYAKWVNEDEEDASVYQYKTLSDGTVEIVSYKGKRRYLTIPDELDGKTVSSVGAGAFAYNTRLREVILPEGLVYVQEGAFQGAQRLRKIVFTGDQLIRISPSAFRKCKSLRALELPDSVQVIGASAFQGCSALTSVTISENSALTAIGTEAFAETAISAFYIPKHVSDTGFDGRVLMNSTNMRRISVHGENSAFQVNDGTLYNADGTIIVYYPAGLTGSYTVADGVRSIETHAFAGSAISGIELNAVTQIGESAFAGTKKLTAVTLPDTVTSLGEAAFKASAVSQVTFSGAMTEVSDHTFSKSALAAVSIPENIQSIGESAFSGCAYLTELKFAERSGLLRIGRDAFSGCAALGVFTLPDSLTSISAGAFSGCRSITEVTIPAGVSSMGAEAFRYCSGLQSVTFAEGCLLTQIPDSCFANCTMLSEVTFSDGISALGANAFSYDYRLSRLQFGQSSVLAAVGDHAFYSCSALQTMQLPETVAAIGRFAYAFSGLCQVDIGPGVTSIGEAAFGACYGLEQVDVDEQNTVYSAVDNVLFDRDVTTVYCVPASRCGSYTLPATVKTTAPYSFYYDKFLTAVILPEGLETIQMNSFYSCSMLAGVEIPASVTGIGRKAFENCRQMKDVSFAPGSRLQRLGIDTFVRCGFSEITIPASVEEIAQYAFYKCSNLKTITFEENSRLTYVASYLFKGTEVEQVVFESGSALTSIQAHAFDGASGLTCVDFGDAEIIEIGNYAFFNCARLEQISIPDTVSSIGRYAFYGCEKLDRIDLSSAVDYIGESAFFGTNSLKVFFESDELPANAQTGWDSGIAGYFLGAVDYVVSGDWEYSIRRDGTITLAAYRGTAEELTIDTVDGYTVSKIGVRCFYDLDQLRSITLGDSLTEIGNEAFRSCGALTAVTVPASVERIGKYAFADSPMVVSIAQDAVLEEIDEGAFAGNGTQSLTLPDSVIKIGDGAFLGSALTALEITQSSSLQSIGRQAFMESGLSTVYLPAALETVGAESFKNTSALEQVTIAGGDTALKISNSAFEGSAIREITIPARVYDIGEYAFGGCPELQDILVDDSSAAYTDLDGVLCDIRGTTLIQYPGGRSGAYEVPGQITVLNYASFQNAAELTEVTFAAESAVKTIGWQTFSGCVKLEKITVPDSVESLDLYAFENCTALMEVVLGAGSGLRRVGAGAFYGCTALTGISLPDTVEEIGNSAFYNCSALTVFPLTETARVKGIYDYAFFGCGGITRIPALSSLEEIGPFAFAATGITEFTVGAAGKEIASDAFQGCENLTTILCDEENEEYTAIGGALYEAGADSASDYDALVVWPYGNVLVIGTGKTEITAGDTQILQRMPHIRWQIAETVTAIGTEAFKDHKLLRSITIPENIKTIGSFAFYGCSSLEEIHFNATQMEDLDASARVFRYAGSAGDGIVVTVGANVTRIPANLFQVNYSSLNTYTGAGLEKLIAVVFEENSACAEIGKDAFYGCHSYTLIFRQESLPEGLENLAIGSPVCTNVRSYGIDPNGLLYCITNDDTAVVCKYLGDRKHLEVPAQIDGYPVERIASDAFCYNDVLTSVVISEGITDIGMYAFSDATRVERVVIPEGVTTLARGLFNGCTMLRELCLPESLTTIEEYAIYNCDSLEEFVVPKQVTCIGNYALASCAGLKRLVIQENVKSVGTSAFSYCPELQEVELRASDMEDVTADGKVFYRSGTGSGIQLTVGSKVSRIPAYLFYSGNVTEATFADGGVCAEIGAGAFCGCAGLTAFDIPACVTSIGNDAFANCAGLTHIVIPETVAAFGTGVFSGCTGLTSAGPIGGDYGIEFTWTDSIPQYAFSGCTGLTQVCIPDTVTTIETGAFHNCAKLSGVTIPESVTAIGNEAFYGCVSLEEIRFLAAAMDDLASYNRVFYNAGTSGDGVRLIIGEHVTKIPAYLCCPDDGSTFNLTEVVFAEGSLCGKIRDYAFAYCDSLTEFPVAENITYIGSGAFLDCDNLRFAWIHSAQIAGSYWSGLLGNRISGIAVASGIGEVSAGIEENYTVTEEISRDGIRYTCYSYYAHNWSLESTVEHLECQQDGCETYRCGYCLAVNEVITPAHALEHIESRAASCTEVGWEAYEACSRCDYSTYLEIPAAGHTEVTDAAVAATCVKDGLTEGSHCSVCQAVLIPQEVIPALGGDHDYDAVFTWAPDSMAASVEVSCGVCGLSHEYAAQMDFVMDEAAEYVQITASAEHDGVIYEESRTEAVTEMDSGTCGASLNWMLTKFGALFISGSGTMTTYSSSSPAPWNSYAQQITTLMIGADVASLGSYAFYGCVNLERIYFDAAAMYDLSGNNYVFYQAGVETDGIHVVFGADVTKVPAYLFWPYQYDTTTNLCNVTDVVFELGSVCESIGNSAFAYCQELSSIRIPASVTELGTAVFAGCAKLTTAGPAGGGYALEFEWTEEIPGYAFQKCTGLTEAVIPESITSIGSYAFSDCSVLEAVTLPDGLTSIGYHAFGSCNALTGITIPEQVTYIGSGAFYYCRNLTQIHYNAIAAADLTQDSNVFNGAAANSRKITLTVGPQVTKIPAYLFYGVSYLQCVEFEDGSVCESIGNYAFWKCTALKKLEIPGSVASMGSYCLNGCTALTSAGPIGGGYDLEFGWTDQIPAYTFYGCTGLTSVLLPDTITGIGEYAFYACKKLDAIEIPDGLSNIGKYAFNSCAKLSYLYIPESVKTIGNYAFGSCSGLITAGPAGGGYSIEFAWTDAIPARAFYGSAVRSVEIPESVTTIGSYAFHNCTSLGSIRIPASVTTIGSYAFFNCSSLDVVMIDGSKTASAITSETAKGYLCSYASTVAVLHGVSAGSYITGNLTTVETVNIDGQSYKLYADHSHVWSEQETVRTFALVTQSSDPECRLLYSCDTCGVERHDVFDSHDLVHHDGQEAGCTEDGWQDYDTCTRCAYSTYQLIPMTGHSYEITVTEPSCTEPGCTDHVCANCGDSYTTDYVDALGHSYESVRTEATCTQDGCTTYTCTNCGDSYVEDITEAVGHSYVNGVCSVCGENRTVASGWSGYTQWILTNDGVLTVCGEGNMKNYGYAGGQPWADYSDQITSLVIEAGVSSIGSGAFMNLTALETVTLPETGLSKIGEAAFYGCTALTEICIPDGVYTIWSYTFKNCTALESVRLPATLIKIDQGAFEGCIALSYVFIPGNTQIIGAWSFKGCAALTEADMQWADATEIRAGAFKNCTALTTVQLPAQIQILGESAFYGIGAAEFTIPATVETVGAWCFARAGSLAEITFVGDAPTIGEGAFNKITLTAYYPADNATWTASVMQNYGGTVVWTAV